MFAKPLDLEAQPLTTTRSSSGLARGVGGFLLTPVSIRNIVEKNQQRLRWRRLRSSLGNGGKLRHKQQDKKMPPLGLANPMRFLQEDCPEDVLSLIVAFMGPQQAAVLHRTNRHWKNIMEEEATWKVLCKELYKVSRFMFCVIGAEHYGYKSWD